MFVFVFTRLGQSVVRQLRHHQGKGLSLVFRTEWRVQTMQDCGAACILGVLLRRVRGSSQFPMCLLWYHSLSSVLDSGWFLLIIGDVA